MARLTLDQINALIPSYDQFLSQRGIQQTPDGYYNAEGSRVSPGQIDEMRNGSDFGLSGRQALDQNGVIDTSFFTGLSPYMQKKYGNSIQSADDYLKYLYGGQGERVGNYWVLPEGVGVDQTVNPRFVNDSPDPRSFGLAKMAILSLAAAGLTGALPGTESVFGSTAGSAAGTDAAINAGGLDGALGDSIANYSAGMGGNSAFSFSGLGSGLPTGGDMGFFSDILGDGGLTDIFSGSTDMGLSGAGGFGGETPWWSNLPSYGDPLTAAGIGGGATAAGSGLGMGAFGDILTQAVPSSSGLSLDTIKNLYNGAKSLFGGNTGSSGSGFNLGDLLGGKNIFGTAVSAAPFLAAVNYAQNQSPFDTSRLTSLYDKYNPDAATFEYDQNTATGRRNLTDSLTSRGVFGSSFGNSDINSFNTNRELGRGALVNQGVGVAGNLASSILDAQVKERALKNDLYGRALSGLGSALSPKSSIFG